VIVMASSLGLFPPGEGPAPDPNAVQLDAVVSLQRGDYGPLVEHLQERLARAGFRPGEIDGRFGRDTYQAVLAFEKHHEIERDGVFAPDHWDLLSLRPTVRFRSDADRIEVDLAKQVLYLIRDNSVQNVVGISSGNGATFTNYAGREVRARTPEGTYEFYFERNYYHTSYLGAMYKPYYFSGGYAIHGSPNVPGYPASHGCVRVTNTDMDFLRTELELGMTIMLYGLRTENPPAMAAGSAVAFPV
jgi:peptidoglycan hydrolase-like protein with peptidoglycan-binding domain